MRFLALLGIFLASSTPLTSAMAQTIEIVSPHQSVSLTLAELKKKLKTSTVEIQDPVYQRKMSYDAFALNEVLQLAGATPEDKADELVFTAQDGYAPNMKFAKLKLLRGYLAYQEHGTQGKFPLVEQGKAKLTPGPFYVVWDKSVVAVSEVPWPYQLVRIEVVDWAKKFARVIPPQVTSDSLEMKGFLIFKNECIRCHSINLQGGDIGPELNAPQNVTEYWKPEVIRAFIRDSSSFRFKSKMPSFKNLTDKNIDALIRYLTHMKSYKVTPHESI